ncbi:MAG: hypothetical protein EOM51_11185 [Clostridia bacterium]|nr:hypothetical protein [Clostridia bacterium]
MNSDIRILTSFLTSRKRKKLRAILGDRSDSYLIDLWLQSAISRPKGILHDMTAEDISIDSGWSGDPAVFVDALIRCGFLDLTEAGEYALHDWAQHQPWAVGAEERSLKAKKAAAARWEMSEEDNTEGDATSMLRACKEHAVSNAPLLSLPTLSRPRSKDKKHMCVSSSYSPDFEEFWKQYPHFNRNKKGAYAKYQACLKGKSRNNKATPEQLLRAARRYSEAVRDQDPQYVLHATTFLGEQERWFEYDKPLKNSNGEVLRDDVDKNDFLKGDGVEVDWKAYERAKRGYEPYTPGQGRQKTTSENLR